jgi:hypothetical protein
MMGAPFSCCRVVTLHPRVEHHVVVKSQLGSKDKDCRKSIGIETERVD